MSKIDLMKYLSDSEVDNIYRRIYTNNFNISREEKINLIYEAYEENSFLTFALNDEELDFLNNHLNKTYFDENFITISLSQIGLFLKDDFGNLIIPEEIYPLVRNGLKYYYQNKNVFENFKSNFYLLTGILRVKGALRKKDFLRYIDCFTDKPKDLFYQYNISPYFHRFFKKIKYGQKTYYTYQELMDKIDLDFVKYQREDEEIDYDLSELIEIGKHYFIYSSHVYENIMKSISTAVLLNKSSRTDLYIYAALNNFNYEDYLDKDLIENMPSLEYEAFNEFMTLTKPFYPSDHDSLFWDSYDEFVIKDYRTDLLDFAAKFYGINPYESDQKFEEFIDMLNSDDFSVVDELISELGKDLLDDELELLQEVRNSKVKEYVVYKLTNKGLILIDESNKFYLVKINFNTYDAYMPKYEKMKALLVKYHGRLLIFFNYHITKISKKEKEYYNELYDNGVDIIK